MKLIAPNQKHLGELFFESAIDYMEMTVDDNHQIRIEPGGLIRLLQGCDLRRFKQCTVCRKIIWADRLDVKYCSKDCSNRASQRVYQSDEKKRAAYNENRRETYNLKVAQKKAQLKAKERGESNGTL